MQTTQSGLTLPGHRQGSSTAAAAGQTHKIDAVSSLAPLSAGGSLGPVIQPDLSHLTPEERRIIEDVINRQRQEELMDRSQATISKPQVVHRGSKMFQRLPTLPSDPSNPSSYHNSQMTNSTPGGGPIARAKDEFFGGVTRRGTGDVLSVQHNRTSGDLFGAVSSLFIRSGSGAGDSNVTPSTVASSDVCEICRVTKFTSSAGHNCGNCNLKTCVRCGGWFGAQSSWMCKNCFSSLSAPSTSQQAPAPLSQSLETKDTLPTYSTATTTSTSVAQSRPATRSISHVGAPANIPSSSRALVTSAPNDRSISGYAGVANRPRMRNALRDHRSVSEEERVWSHYQPAGPPPVHSHSHPYTGHRTPPPQTHQPHPNPYVLSGHPGHPLPPHSSQPRHPQRQQSYSASTAPRFPYGTSAAAALRHSTGVGLMRKPPPPPLVEPQWGPPPSNLRAERKSMLHRDTAGGGSAKGSPRGGFQAAYLRRTTGGHIDPGSVSEPCQSDAFLRGDYRKSFTAEIRMYQSSVDADRPATSRSAFWSASPDGEGLIGQVYLRKSRTSGEIGLLSSFGIKLVIGKRVPSDMVGTFLSYVKEGSVADVMGELQMGDEILEWNGNNLRGLHQEEVSEILASSRNNDEVWLVVQRVIDDYYEESDGATSTSLSRCGDDRKFREDQEDEDEYGVLVGRRDTGPHLQLKLRYDEGKEALVVTVLAARDLPPQLNHQTWLCNSFCQITILPETNKYESRCTRVVHNTNDPVWIHSFTFSDFDISDKELEVAVFDYLQGRTSFIGEVLINLQVADLSGRAYWYPIPPPWDATDQDLSSQVHSESGTFEADDWSGEASERGGLMHHSPRPLSGGELRTLRNISPRSVPSHLSASGAGRQRRQQVGVSSRQHRRETRAPAKPTPPRTHGTDQGARFTLSEDDQSVLSDNSEASGFSSFSKLSLQSSCLRQGQKQSLSGGGGKISSSGRRMSSRVSRSHPNCRSPSQDFLAEAVGEDDEDVEEGEADLEQGRMPSSQASSCGLVGKSMQDRRHPLNDDQPKSSSAEEKSASSSTAATTALESSSVSKAAAQSSAAESAAAARKRRSSIGHKFSNVLGISKKNTSAGGTDKKSKASFQRSEEVLPAYIHTNEKGTVSGGYKAPGVVAEGAGFGGIAASSVQSSTIGASSGHHGSSIPHPSSSVVHSVAGSLTDAGPRKEQLALEMGEVHVGEFVEGLGPGQLVGRQVLGMPCLGEIQLSFFDRKGHLEVEVIRARGLQQKNTSKPLPTPYVKLHLLEGKQSVEKMRTTAPARRTLDPLFQQQFSFSNSYKDKILQVSVWGEYGRMDKKVFLGMCEIVLDDLNLRSIVFGWYKLFGMIAATAQHHKQVRRHSSSSGATGAPHGVPASSSSSSSKQRGLTKSRSGQARGKS